MAANLIPSTTIVCAGLVGIGAVPLVVRRAIFGEVRAGLAQKAHSHCIALVVRAWCLVALHNCTWRVFDNVVAHTAACCLQSLLLFV